jgi:[ribosomal protein S5]-alanine N-acetyltransferase
MQFSYAAETDKVRIEPIGVDDVSDAYVNWFKDPEVGKFLVTSSDQTRESVRAYIESSLKDPNSCMWKILYKDPDGKLRHVGNAKLSNIKKQHRNAYISYMLGDKSVWGKGVATHVCRLVTTYAFNELKLHKVYAAIVEDNIGSKISLQRVGYRVEAFLNEDGFVDGRPIASLYMSIFNGGIIEG